MIHYSSFPNLRNAAHRKTSEPLSGENCIAHAVGARGEWWEPVLGRIWPLGAPYYNHKVESLVRVVERIGYVLCDSAKYEPNYEKLAIYGKGYEYTHVARQLGTDGTWTSKLGPEDDINHAALEALDGPEYGSVVKIMKRRRSSREEVKCCEDQDQAVQSPSTAFHH